MTEHDEIRSLLSAYCGDDLSPRERERVEEHLAACPDCRLELADLETTLRLVRSQPLVEPPPWMAGRIMARVREEGSQQRGWLQRLFVPLHVKLPLEALAIVIVCFVSYYVVKDSGQQLLAPPTPAPSVPPPAVEEKATVPQGEPKPAAVPPPPASGKPQPAPAAPPVPATPPADQGYAPAPQRPAAESAAPAAPRRDHIPPAAPSREAVRGEPEPTLESAPRRQKAATEENKSRALDGDAVRGETDSYRGAPAPVAPMLQVRMAVDDPTGAEPSIRHAIARSGGIVRGQPSTRQLLVRIAAQRLPELLGHLATIGALAESPTVEGLAGAVELTIRW